MALITLKALMHLDPQAVYELLTFWFNSRSPISLLVIHVSEEL